MRKDTRVTPVTLLVVTEHQTTFEQKPAWFSNYLLGIMHISPRSIIASATHPSWPTQRSYRCFSGLLLILCQNVLYYGTCLHHPASLHPYPSAHADVSPLQDMGPPQCHRPLSAATRVLKSLSVRQVFLGYPPLPYS